MTRIGTIVFILFVGSGFAQANEGTGFVCAADSATRWVVRVVEGYTLMLSRYDGFEKTYFDVRFGIADRSESAEGMISYVSDVQQPDGDNVEVTLLVKLNESGVAETARWLGIEFFPRDGSKNYAGLVTVNQKQHKATCIELN